MQECDRSAFLDTLIESVATKLWCKLSQNARTVFPVVGSHAALCGSEEPMDIERICEHCGLTRHQASAALIELESHGMIHESYCPGTSGPAYRLAGSTEAIPDEMTFDQHATPEAIRAFIEDGGLKVYGNLTIHVEEPTVELIKLTANLAKMLSAQASAKESEEARIAEKVEIVRYKDPIPDLTTEAGL